MDGCLAFKAIVKDGDVNVSQVSIHECSPNQVFAIHHNEENPADKIRLVLVDACNDALEHYEPCDAIFSMSQKRV